MPPETSNSIQNEIDELCHKIDDWWEGRLLDRPQNHWDRVHRLGELIHFARREHVTYVIPPYLERDK